jgi:hypothetical protein
VKSNESAERRAIAQNPPHVPLTKIRCVEPMMYFLKAAICSGVDGD